MIDEMGMGKTMTALVAAMDSKEQMHGAYNLIVTTKSCVGQWASEAQSIYTEV